MESPDSYADLYNLIHNPGQPGLATPRTPVPFAARLIDFDEETLDGEAELAMDDAIEDLRDTDEEVEKACVNEDVKWLTTLGVNRSVRLARNKATVKEDKLSLCLTSEPEGAKKRKRASLYPPICRSGRLGKGMMAIASPVDWHQDIFDSPNTFGAKNGELTAMSDGERAYFPSCRVTDKYSFYLWDDTFWAPLIVTRRVRDCFPHDLLAASGEVRTPKGRVSCGDLYVVTNPSVLAEYRAHMLLVRSMEVGPHRYASKYSSCYAIQEDNSAIDFCKLNFQDWFEESGRPNVHKAGSFGSFECFVNTVGQVRATKRTVKKSMFGALMNATTGQHLTLADIRIDMCEF